MHLVLLNSIGRMPEWTKGADCKSVIRGFESHSGLFGGAMGDAYGLMADG